MSIKYTEIIKLVLLLLIHFNMNSTDFFYWFINSAALNSDSNILYFYDTETDSVLRLSTGTYEPLMYNATAANLGRNEPYYRDIFLKINSISKRIWENDPKVHLLPSYTENELKYFLQNFIETITDEYKKEIALKYDWRKLLFTHVTNAPTPRTQKNFELQWEYSSKLGVFINHFVDKYYFPLGINEEKTQHLF